MESDNDLRAIREVAAIERKPKKNLQANPQPELEKLRLQLKTAEEESRKLRVQLEEVNDALQAMQRGEVDALVVSTREGEQIFTLSGAEHSYRLMMERMKEGAAILAADGTILYCNRSFADMVKTPLEKMIGMSITEFCPIGSREFLGTHAQRGSSGMAHEGVLLASDRTAISVLFSVSNLESRDFGGQSCVVVTDISRRIEAERLLRDTEENLRIKTATLEEVNVALRVLLKQVEERQIDLEERILLNIRELVSPYLDKLKKTPLSGAQLSYLHIAETNIDHIASSFLYHLKMKYLGLTHREVQIASLVKDGISVKEISGLLNISKKTVEFHKNSLRKKLGLSNRKVNLRIHLQTILHT